jgi:hypothetical protein
VTGVYVAGTAWSPAFRQHLADAGVGSAAFGYLVPDGFAQLDELPWANLNQVSVRFSIDVVAHQEDLTVSDRNTGAFIQPTGFTYDPASHTATWTLPQSLRNDNYWIGLEGRPGAGVRGTFNGLALNGYWTNGQDTYPSGHASPPSDFSFWLNVLPGDADRSGTVDAADVTMVRTRQFTSVARPGTGSAGYTRFADLNGSGTIDAIDQMLVRSRLGTTLAIQQPPPPSPATAQSAGTRLTSRTSPPRRDLFGTTPILA